MRTLPVSRPVSVKSLMRKKCIAPKMFQRRSVWDKGDKTPYIVSVNNCDALSTIVVANIDECMDYCKGDYPQCYRRFSDLFEQGWRYIILDGQNRMEALQSFYNNEYGVHGELLDKDGNYETLTNVTKFRDLKAKYPRLHDSFSDAEVLVMEVGDRNWIDLHGLFKKINAGQPLNAMEVRNSMTTFASGYFRNLAESTNFREILKKVHGFSDNRLKRMLDIETAIRAYMMTSNLRDTSGEYVLRNQWLSDRAFDSLYQKGEGFRPQKDVIEYNEDSLNRFEIILQILNKLVTSYSDTKNPLPQKMLWTYLTLAEYIYDRNLVGSIQDFSSLCSDYYDLIRKLEASSTEDYSSDLNKYNSKIAKISDAISSEKDELERKLLKRKLTNLHEPAKSRYFFFQISDLKKGSQRQSVNDDIHNALLSFNFSLYALDADSEVSEEISEDCLLASK